MENKVGMGITSKIDKFCEAIDNWEGLEAVRFNNVTPPFMKKFTERYNYRLEEVIFVLRKDKRFKKPKGVKNGKRK